MAPPARDIRWAPARGSPVLLPARIGSRGAGTPVGMAHKPERRRGERYRDAYTGRFLPDRVGELLEHVNPPSVRRSRVAKPKR